MIKIDISGMSDGEYEFDFNVPIATLENLFDEFTGNIEVFVLVNKLIHRYTMYCKCNCLAKLICDRSLEEYTENIEAEFNLAFRADTILFNNLSEGSVQDNEVIIREDTKYIDISKEILEQLALNLPMKRVAPKYRDKDISEIFPELNEDRIVGENSIDNRWLKLKDLKIN